MQHKLFKKILTVNENNTKLFQLFSDSLTFQCIQGTIVCTKGSGVVANIPMLTEHFQPCNQEEADKRLFVHANDTAWNDLRRIMIAANDKDVAIIALYTFSALKVDKLWIEYSIGKNQRWLPVHQHPAKLGDNAGTIPCLPLLEEVIKGPETHGKHSLR